MVDPNATEAEPAGNAKSAKAAKQGGGSGATQRGHSKTGSTVPIANKPGLGPRNHLPPPFQGGYFPGHVEKVVTSPNK